MEKPLVPAKLEAYQALVCSGSTPVSNPSGILVVLDCKVRFLSDVIYIDDSDSEEPSLSFLKDYEVELNDSDGYGLISPELSKKWHEELSGEGVCSGFCIRNAWCKGMVYCFDFHKFAQEVACTNEVIDAWGDVHNIHDIQLVITTSMLKLWDSYKSIEDYITNCRQNHYTFSVTKICPQKLESYRTLNYQFLQSYNLTNQQIMDLVSPTVSEIKDILGNDYNKMLIFCCGGLNSDFAINKIELDYIKALMVDKRMVKDPFVMNHVKKMISKRIRDAKLGAIVVHGNWSAISGDPYALCQSIFRLKITGLLKEKEIYNQYWADSQVNKVVGYRAPMTCHNNIRVFNIVNTSEMKKWYSHMKTVTIFNAWDTAAHALNGADKDGDQILLTDNPVLLETTKELPAIICVQKKASAKIASQSDLVEANIKGFGDDIGKITNKVTSMYDIQAQFPSDSLEYKILDYRIKCGQLYQQNAIDRAKGIVAKPMPPVWFNSSLLKISNNDTPNQKAIKELNSRIVADKKPYFFIYRYPEIMRKYKQYVNNARCKCLMEFNITLQNLLEKKDKSQKEERFIYYYKRNMPITTHQSTMNRICWYVENELDNWVSLEPSEFDYRILKSNYDYAPSRYYSVKKLYEVYQRNLHSHSIRLNCLNKEEENDYREGLKQWFVKEIAGICPNEYELANIVLDICYVNNKSKQFAWDMCGHVFVENLLKENQWKFIYPIQSQMGNIMYGGISYFMSEKNIGVDGK